MTSQNHLSAYGGLVGSFWVVAENKSGNDEKDRKAPLQSSEAIGARGGRFGAGLLPHPSTQRPACLHTMLMRDIKGMLRISCVIWRERPCAAWSTSRATHMLLHGGAWVSGIGSIIIGC